MIAKVTYKEMPLEVEFDITPPIDWFRQDPDDQASVHLLSVKQNNQEIKHLMSPDSEMHLREHVLEHAMRLDGRLNEFR